MIDPKANANGVVAGVQSYEKPQIIAASMSGCQ